MTKKKSAVIIFTSFTLAWGAHALGLLNGFGAAQPTSVSSISTYVGNFFLGGGLFTNENIVQTEPSGPWDAYQRPPTSNVIFQSTGVQNILRNSSMTSWSHYKYITQDRPATFPYLIGIASFTATISGTTMTVTGTPTGALVPWQRVSDAANFTTTASSAVGTTTLTFASTTGIAVGMHVSNLTHPRSIAGNITVASLTGTVVTLSHEIGFTGNDQMIGAPGVSSGDTIAFGAVLRGTSIVRQLTGTAGAAGTYELNTTNAVAVGKTMGSAGGWGPDGVYIIPVGTAGTGNYVECYSLAQGFNGGMFTPVTINCTITGTLSDIIFRFPIDYVDAARFQCGVYTGAPRNCISSNNLIQPVTFQFNVTYSDSVTVQPSLSTKNPCPLIGVSQVGANSCLDDWTNASTDLELVTMPACDSMMTSTPISCTYGYTWIPTGVVGGYQIEFHTNAIPGGETIIVGGFDLKQTPGATCLGTAPPCFQYVTGPIEIAEVVTDLQRNMRFAQLLGQGWAAGWNSGNAGFTETTAGFASSTTTFHASWPLPVSIRCNLWYLTQKSAPSCAPPYVHFQNVTDYTFMTSAAQFNATALATGHIGLNSIQIIATSSGLTAGQAGYVHWGSGTSNLILIDSSIIGD